MFGLSVATCWLIAGALMLALEAFGIPGVGLLFVGLAAIVVGILVQFGILGAEAHVLQFAIFFGMSAVTAASLWKTLKRWRTNPKTAGSYQNMVGDSATVGAGGLKAGSGGQVTWSGTIMEAQLDSSAGAVELAPGTLVEITAVKGNRLTVKPV